MIIEFTKPFKDEDNIDRSDEMGHKRKVMLWSNHRNYGPGLHPRSGQSNLLVITSVKGCDGYFISKERFREFVLNGTIEIIS